MMSNHGDAKPRSLTETHYKSEGPSSFGSLCGFAEVFVDTTQLPFFCCPILFLPLSINIDFRSSPKSLPES
jgi:hypothetical protein